MLLKIFLYGQTPAQKNNKQVAYNSRTGKPFILTNSKVKLWQQKATEYLRDIEPVEGKVSIEMLFWNKDKRSRDLDNMMTSILDLLKNNKIIEDDNCFIVGELKGKFIGIDKNNPRVEITIKTIDN